ncbi:MAG: type II toxin-antitoxin system RelE/ParE family toxin [Bacteroidota bacterium]
MVKIHWTLQAHEDLHAIFEYISHDSRRVARLFVEKIYHRAGQLRSFPFSGRIVPEVDEENVRELIYRNYRIVYKVDQNAQVDILTVFHSSKVLDDTMLST